MQSLVELITQAENLTEPDYRLSIEKGIIIHAGKWQRGWTVHMGVIFKSAPTLIEALTLAITAFKVPPYEPEINTT